MSYRFSREDYTVGWMCALPLEMAAAKAMLDANHPQLPQPPEDYNSYALGEICGHNVVIACLPAGVYGTTSATSAAKDMLSTYTAIRFGLMVGIGGGAPSEEFDIRLGDVVVSKPGGLSGGVVQYDFGKTMAGGQLEHTGTLNKPPSVLLTALSNLQSEEMLGKGRVNEFLSAIILRYAPLSHFIYPGAEQDHLYKSEYHHLDLTESCNSCDQNMRVERPTRPSTEPRAFYGLVASGNQVMKDGPMRDQLAKKHGILCFEMEAAGLMDHFPCLVIRGICDYSDSHKNKQWQEYAAAAGAAYAKNILSLTSVASTQNTAYMGSKREVFRVTPKDEECLRALFLTDPEEDKSALKRRKGDRAHGTCEWILETNEIKEWLEGIKDMDGDRSVLWLYGNPGTGKSTMAVTLAEEIPKRGSFMTRDKFLAYFFCDSAVESRRTVTAILRGLLYQLVRKHQPFLQYFRHKFSERQGAVFGSFDALWSILMQIGNDDSTGHKYCVIDALDECDRESQEALLTQLRQQYHHFTGKHEQKLHFLITSRPYPEIDEQLRVFSNKNLSEYYQAKHDINKMICEKVTELKRKKKYTERIEREVTQTLQNKAEGTFLWVGIACQELSHVRSRDAVNVLWSLPRGLDSLYKALLDNAMSQHEDEQEKIAEILDFVAVAHRPMTVCMLSRACQLYEDEPDEDRLAFFREDIDMCRLMVIVQNDVVRLLHKSVKDFLLGPEGEVRTRNLKAHATLAYRCIDFLTQNLRESNDPAAGGHREPFFDYAVNCWPEHAHSAKMEFSILDQHLTFFQPQCAEREIWARCLDVDVFSRFHPKLPDRNGISLFYIAARWGLVPLGMFALQTLEELALVENSDQYLDDEFLFHDVTPLHIAASLGHVALVKLLVGARHSDMKITEQVVYGAVSNSTNGQDVLRVFLNQMPDRVEITDSILQRAAQNTGCRHEIFEALMDQYGQELSITDDVLKHVARNEGCGAGIMKLFLDRVGSKISVTAEILESAISNERQNKEVLALLLTCNNKAPITEEILETVIYNKYNTKEVARLLFAHADGQKILTKRLVLAAASHVPKFCNELIGLMLKYHKSVACPRAVAELIARWCDLEVMEMLFDVAGGRIRITDSMVEAARGEGVKDFLVDRRRSQPTTGVSFDDYIPVSPEDFHVPFYRCCPVKQIHVLDDHEDEVWGSTFSSTGTRFATSGRDAIIKVYSTTTFQLLGTLAEHCMGISCLQWSPDGRRLISGSQDNTVRVWDGETYTCLHVIDVHNSPVVGVAWANDGKSFISASLDRKTALCHWTDTGQLLHCWSEDVRVQGCCLTLDSSQIIAIGVDPCLYLYSVETHARITTIVLDSKPTGLAITQHTSLALVDLSCGQLQLIDLADGHLVRRFRSARQKGKFVTRSVFFGDGNSLIVGSSEDGRICVWDRDSGCLLDILEEHGKGCVNSISTNPANPNMFISTGDDKTTRVWEMCAIK